MHVTRTNEALDIGYQTQVQQEHRRIADSVMRGDPEAARQAAREHMQNAAFRLEHAAPAIRHTLDALLTRTPTRTTP
jgi:DNA-binding FadR family transcriptional regulator